MTGENFKRIDRKSYKLERLCEAFRKVRDENMDIYFTKIRYGEATSPDLEKYEENVKEMRKISREMYYEAFYHYGRSDKLASDYVSRHGESDCWR